MQWNQFNKTQDLPCWGQSIQPQQHARLHLNAKDIMMKSQVKLWAVARSTVLTQSFCQNSTDACKATTHEQQQQSSGACSKCWKLHQANRQTQQHQEPSAAKPVHHDFYFNTGSINTSITMNVPINNQMKNKLKCHTVVVNNQQQQHTSRNQQQADAKNRQQNQQLQASEQSQHKNINIQVKHFKKKPHLPYWRSPGIDKEKISVAALQHQST